jgi:hypothetical protein
MSIVSVATSVRVATMVSVAVAMIAVHLRVRRAVRLRVMSSSE